MDINFEEVITAIDTVYNQYAGIQDPQKIHQASAWLGQLQKSVQAWKIADQLLHMKRGVNSCFFGAHTLRTKIQYNFSELPPESHVSLRTSLLQHLSHITPDTYQGITTQLCVAVADLALHMSSWNDPVVDLTSEFGPGSSKENLDTLLEVLIAIPEEKLSRQLKLGQIRRDQLAQYLKSKVQNIIQLLHVVMGSDKVKNENIHVKCLRCLSSWFNVHTCDWAHLLNSCVINDVINIVKTPQISVRLHEVGTDAICSAMIMLEEKPIPELTAVLFAGVLQLEEAFHMAVALEDLSAVTNYARMFAELGETLLEVIVQQCAGNSNSAQVLHLLLVCVGHHEWEVAEITFTFWYKLSEVIYRKREPHIHEAFKPYFDRLIEALFRHCQIDSDHEGILLEQDDFFEFRERVQELIKDVAYVSGSKHYFVKMSELLAAPDAVKAWNVTEAALFIMQSVARNLLPKESSCVPSVMEAILSQDDSIHIQVAYTSVQLIGELNEWLAQRPYYLPQVLAFLTKKLQRSQQLSVIAAKSLDLVCNSCVDHIQEHFEGLMSVVESLDALTISNEAVVGLLKAVSNIMGRLPKDQIQVNMKSICSAQVKNLQKLINEDKPVEKNSSTDPAIWLDRLAAIFRSVNPTIQNGEIHPCQEVVMEIWPTLSATFEKYSIHLRIMEHCCRCLRFAVRCVHQQSAPLLPALVDLIVREYSKTGFSCFVYLGSILVDEYASEEGCVAGLLGMLQAFMQPTFAILTRPNGFKDHPDTVDDWFRLCTRFLQRSPVHFLQCQVIKEIIDCGLQACLLDHKDASSAVLKFFQDLLDTGIKKDTEQDFVERKRIVTEIVDVNGPTLLNNLITAAVAIVPSYMLHDIAETIFHLMIFDRTKFCAWLEATLKNLPRTNSTGSTVITDSHIIQLHTSITKAHKTKEVLWPLSDFSRCYT